MAGQGVQPVAVHEVPPRRRRGADEGGGEGGGWGEAVPGGASVGQLGEYAGGVLGGGFGVGE